MAFFYDDDKSKIDADDYIEEVGENLLALKSILRLNISVPLVGSNYTIITAALKKIYDSHYDFNKCYYVFVSTPSDEMTLSVKCSSNDLGRPVIDGFAVTRDGYFYSVELIYNNGNYSYIIFKNGSQITS